MEISSSTVVSVVSVVSGGGLAALFTVFRLSKKDVSQSNFDYIKEWNAQFKERETAWTARFTEQDAKLSAMNRELGELSGRLFQAMEHNAAKDTEISLLKSEVARLVAQLAADKATAAALASTGIAVTAAGHYSDDQKAAKAIKAGRRAVDPIRIVQPPTDK